MRRLVLYLFILVCATSMTAQRNCGAMDHLHHQMEQDPKRAEKLAQIERHTNEYIQSHKPSNHRAIVTIPVVVHVVYRTSAENISAAQIQTQIDVLNEDFRRLNIDADNTWPQADDVEIEFCLATVDPDGNPTTGITRTATSVNGFGTNDAVKSNSSGGVSGWPSHSYLNFWVCNIGGGILGYAQFPGGNPATDGVVNDYRYTGTIGTATAPFDLGRTATHEIGHWLNLRHIWGDGPCSADDFVADTPTSDASNGGCNIGHVSCGTVDMVQNYMDYSNDACMNLFTAGQKSRMLALFSPGGARASMLTSAGCGNGNPPPPPSSCDNNVVNVSITFDNYPEETSWSITDNNGSIVATGGTYGSEPDGSTIDIDVCLVDGCYDFTINDAYGDGICCSYGNGSYKVSSSDDTYVSGGNFGSSEKTSFCVSGGAPVATCDDGLQNGSETGVDCGGSCSPCPTCSDGVQNGDETGVDCGGSNCNTCATCNDGQQNGSETGVDCGGPDCDPCNTSGNGSTQLLASYFESGLDGWQDGGSDCYRYSGSRSWEGNYSIRLRDNTGTASSMTSPSLDLSQYSSVDITFYFYSYSMENGEDFWLRYNDGAGWETIATWVSGSNFQNNGFYTATVTLSASDYSFSVGDQFRFQVDASANADQIYIDEVTITGVSGSSRASRSIVELRSPVTALSTKSQMSNEEDIMMYPNPATNQITLLADEVINSVTIFDLSGKQLYTKAKINATQTNIDLTSLRVGIYLITIESEEEVVTQKFVKY